MAADSSDICDGIPTQFIPHDEDRPTVPCEVCGTPTEFCGTKRCVNCWEVENRLVEYLESPKAREHVKRLIRNAELEDKVDEWHKGDSNLPLHEYLGMTWEEYGKWVAGDLIK